ncbi:MAG TPA: hypothetical protein VMM57_07605 [Bacteroidota bacterium]|nr:hypothetical protein [Bacteroidota bacterium]
MRRMRFVTLVLVLAGTALLSCTVSPKKSVVAIDKTKTYHRENCPPVHMAKTTVMTAGEARRLNYKPCPICKPDSL